jgi:hypothetical protein
VVAVFSPNGNGVSKQDVGSGYLLASYDKKTLLKQGRYYIDIEKSVV